MWPSFVVGSVKRAKSTIDYSDFDSVKKYAEEMSDDTQQLIVLRVDLGRGVIRYITCIKELEQETLQRYDSIKVVYETKTQDQDNQCSDRG